MDWMKIDPEKKRTDYTVEELKAVQIEGERRLKFLIDTIRESDMPKDQITVGAIMALAVGAYVDFAGEDVGAALKLFGSAWEYATGTEVFVADKTDEEMSSMLLSPTSGKVH